MADSKYLTADEAAHELGVCLSTFQKVVKLSGIKRHRPMFGKGYIYNLNDVVALKQPRPAA